MGTPADSNARTTLCASAAHWGRAVNHARHPAPLVRRVVCLHAAARPTHAAPHPGAAAPDGAA